MEILNRVLFSVVWFMVGFGLTELFAHFYWREGLIDLRKRRDEARESLRSAQEQLQEIQSLVQEQDSRQE